MCSMSNLCRECSGIFKLMLEHLATSVVRAFETTFHAKEQAVYMNSQKSHHHHHHVTQLMRQLLIVSH